MNGFATFENDPRKIVDLTLIRVPPESYTKG